MRRPSEPYSSVRTTEAPVPDEVHVRSAEPRAERSSIATFFGFGPKPDKPEPQTRAETTARPEAPAPVAPEPAPQPASPVEAEASDAPKKRGWWQKRTDS